MFEGMRDKDPPVPASRPPRPVVVCISCHGFPDSGNFRDARRADGFEPFTNHPEHPSLYDEVVWTPGDLWANLKLFVERMRSKQRKVYIVAAQCYGKAFTDELLLLVVGYTREQVQVDGLSNGTTRTMYGNLAQRPEGPLMDCIASHVQLGQWFLNTFRKSEAAAADQLDAKKIFRDSAGSGKQSKQNLDNVARAGAFFFSMGQGLSHLKKIESPRRSKRRRSQAADAGPTVNPSVRVGSGAPAAGTASPVAAGNVESTASAPAESYEHTLQDPAAFATNLTRQIAELRIDQEDFFKMYLN